MKSRLILITVFALCIITVGFTAYDTKKDDKSTSKISTNINKLSQLIILPYQPKAVWWQITRIGTPYTPRPPGPNDWSVDAVLLFDEKDIELILHESQFKQQLELPESIIEDLPELRDLLKSHGSFENKLYKADLFGQSYGSVIRIKGTNMLYVSYTTQ